MPDTRCIYCGSHEAPTLADPPNDKIGAFKCPTCGLVWVERNIWGDATEA